jgi:hypothetical protein
VLMRDVFWTYGEDGMDHGMDLAAGGVDAVA